MLRVEKISKSFGSPGEANLRQVLSDLDFSMEAGESVAVVGPSGSGKTTLLNIIGTLESPGSGKLFFKNRDISRLNRDESDRFRNREIGFVFQSHHLLPQLSLLENVLLPAMALEDKSLRDGIPQRAEKLLKRVGIWEHRDKLPGSLSGGECQRAAVVRALVNSPSLLLADEPTGALDVENAALLAGLLADLNREEKMALLIVTHSMELASGMNKTFHLEAGKLVQKDRNE